MRRIVALVVAALLIGGAVVIRSRLDDNEVARTVRLVCATELEAVCTQFSGRLQATVEPAGTTADRLATAAGDPGLDGWLVPDPWPAIVDARRQSRALPPLFVSQTSLGRSPLVLVVWKERAAALSGRCRGDVNWKCLGEAVAAGPWTSSGGRPDWGPIKPGQPSPSTDATGLLLLGHAVSGWFGRADLSTADFEDDAFDRWFAALARAVPTPEPPEGALQRMLTAGPAAYDAVGTTEAQARAVLATSARQNELNLLYPAPMATADVVLATAATGSEASSVRQLAGGDEARRSLAGLGWQAPGRGGNGLPSPGLLDALRARWKEVTGR